MIKIIEWGAASEDCGIENVVYGGFFDMGMRWNDYIKRMDKEIIPYLEAIKKSVLSKNIRGGGSWHQYDPEGCPKFSDGSELEFSMRAWGDLMAAIWAQAENKDYSYMDFYM